MQVGCLDEDRKLPLLEWELPLCQASEANVVITLCSHKRVPFIRQSSELEKPHLKKYPTNLVR